MSKERERSTAPPRRFLRIVAGLTVPPSRSVVRAAISIAGRNPDADLVFCHAIDMPRMLARAEQASDDYALVLEAVTADAERMLESACAAAREAGVTARPFVRHGSPGRELATLADAIGADLIVAGYQPGHPVLRMIRPSTCDELFEASRRPVLVVPEGTIPPGEFRPASIAVPMAMVASMEPAWRLARDVAADYDASLVLLAGADIEERPDLVVTAVPARRRFRDGFARVPFDSIVQHENAPILVVPQAESPVRRSGPA